jgi:hypothetical protein
MTFDPIAAVGAGVLRRIHAQDEAKDAEDDGPPRGEVGRAGATREGGGSATARDLARPAARSK